MKITIDIPDGMRCVDDSMRRCKLCSYAAHMQACNCRLYGWLLRGVELPKDLWSCIVEDYTPRQKRFAEICREVIVPELKRMIDSKELICRVNGAPCNECIPGAPCAKMAGGSDDENA